MFAVTQWQIMRARTEKNVAEVDNLLLSQEDQL